MKPGKFFLGLIFFILNFTVSALASQLVLAPATAAVTNSPCSSFIVNVPWTPQGNYEDDADNRCGDKGPTAWTQNNQGATYCSHTLVHILPFTVTSMLGNQVRKGMTSNPDSGSWNQTSGLGNGTYPTSGAWPFTLPANGMYAYQLCTGYYFVTMSWTVFNSIDEYQTVYGMVVTNLLNQGNMNPVTSAYINTSDCCSAAVASGSSSGSFFVSGASQNTGSYNIYSTTRSTAPNYLEFYSLDENAHHDDMQYWISGSGYFLYIGGGS